MLCTRPFPRKMRGRASAPVVLTLRAALPAAVRPPYTPCFDKGTKPGAQRRLRRLARACGPGFPAAAGGGGGAPPPV